LATLIALLVLLVVALLLVALLVLVVRHVGNLLGFKGGAEIKGPWGQVIVRNISSHK
jgi:hypothetical protein